VNKLRYIYAFFDQNTATEQSRECQKTAVKNVKNNWIKSDDVDFENNYHKSKTISL